VVLHSSKKHVNKRPESRRVDKSDGITQEDELKSRELPVSRNAELFAQSQEQQRLFDQRPSIKATKRSQEVGDNMELRRKMSFPESIRNRMHPTSSSPIKMVKIQYHTVFSDFLCHIRILAFYMLDTRFYTQIRAQNN
jgi:hypothetical protein